MSDLNFSRPNKDTKLGESNVKFFIGKVVGYNSMKEQIEKGSGWYYKVRILGDHGIKDEIPDEQLDYVQSLLPTTAGSGAAYKMRSVRISQGDTVFGIRGGGKGGKPFIIAVFPRTRNTKVTDGKFGTLSGFWESGTLSDTGILSGEFNDQVGPKFEKGLSGLDPKKWTKATATNPSEKVKEIVPSVKKEKNIATGGTGGTDDTTEEFKEITEEETEKNDVKNNAGKVVDPKEWKPGTPLNTPTMEALKESFEKGEIPPVIWEEALKQASEQGLDGYEEYVVKEEIKKDVEPKKAEYKKTFAEVVNEAKNPPFDSWEKRQLIKLAENDKARIVGEKIGISRETGITFQERKDILKEIKSIEGSLQYRAEVDPNQTIQAGDNAPQNLQQLIIPDSQVAITRDRLLYLTKKLKFIEDGGIVQYPGEFSDRYN